MRPVPYRKVVHNKSRYAPPTEQKKRDGSQLFTGMKEISDRWKELFHQLLNQEGNVDNDATDHLTARETMMYLNGRTKESCESS